MKSKNIIWLSAIVATMSLTSCDSLLALNGGSSGVVYTSGGDVYSAGYGSDYGGRYAYSGIRYEDARRQALFLSDKMAYELLLIEHINAEYEHNITQQIYVSGNLWNVILISKNTTLQIIHRIATDEAIGDAQKLREAIIAEFTDKPSPSTHATAHVVSEVANFI